MEAEEVVENKTWREASRQDFSYDYGISLSTSPKSLLKITNLDTCRGDGDEMKWKQKMRNKKISMLLRM